MNLLSKVVLIISLVSVVKYGFNADQVKQISKDIVSDYKNAGITIKKYVTNEQVNSDELMNEIKAIDQDINNLLNSFDFNNVKDEVTMKFIILTDFIFNDTEIKGVKFNDLTRTSKEVVTDIYDTLNQKIKSRYPNYQETLSKGADYIEEKATTVKEYVNSKVVDAIGEDNYNSIKTSVTDTKDKVVDKAKETYNKAKDKVKDWYNNFKSN